MIRVLIAEDHPIVGRGTAYILGTTRRVRVVGIAGSPDEVPELVESNRPDVVLSDVMFIDRPTGLDLPTLLRARGHGAVPVVFFSSYDLPWFYTRALRAGAAGYVLKSETTESVVQAIERVVAGGVAFPQAVDPRVAELLRPPSVREQEIIALVGRGLGNGEVASALHISAKTVESHLGRLFGRYRLGSRTELAMLAMEQGWIRPGRDARRPET